MAGFEFYALDLGAGITFLAPSGFQLEYHSGVGGAVYDPLPDDATGLTELLTTPSLGIEEALDLVFSENPYPCPTDCLLTLKEHHNYIAKDGGRYSLRRTQSFSSQIRIPTNGSLPGSAAVSRDDSRRRRCRSVQSPPLKGDRRRGGNVLLRREAGRLESKLDIISDAKACYAVKSRIGPSPGSDDGLHATREKGRAYEEKQGATATPTCTKTDHDTETLKTHSCDPSPAGGGENSDERSDEPTVCEASIDSLSQADPRHCARSTSPSDRPSGGKQSTAPPSEVRDKKPLEQGKALISPLTGSPEAKSTLRMLEKRSTSSFQGPCLNDASLKDRSARSNGLDTDAAGENLLSMSASGLWHALTTIEQCDTPHAWALDAAAVRCTKTWLDSQDSQDVSGLVEVKVARWLKVRLSSICILFAK